MGRDWKAMEEEKIKELFTTSKEKVLNCLKQFRVFKIDPQEGTRLRDASDPGDREN